MSLLTFKLLSAAAILAIAVIGGLIPLYAARHENSRRFSRWETHSQADCFWA